LCDEAYRGTDAKGNGFYLRPEGYVLIGYANNPQVLKEGLKKVSEFLAERSH
jgi:hypothetical protein